MKDVSEKNLIELCRQGSREAQQEIYLRTCERIYRMLRGMTGSADDAFDLTQDTYVRALTHLDQFDGRSSLATWLYRIAANEALQFLRRVRRTRALNLEYPFGPIESDHSSPDVRMDVSAALATLDPTDRAILLLRYREGLDYRTIAEVTGVADGTVGSRLNRARLRLRGILEDGYGSREETVDAEHPK